MSWDFLGILAAALRVFPEFWNHLEVQIPLIQILLVWQSCSCLERVGIQWKHLHLCEFRGYLGHFWDERQMFASDRAEPYRLFKIHLSSVWKLLVQLKFINPGNWKSLTLFPAPALFKFCLPAMKSRFKFGEMGPWDHLSACPAPSDFSLLIPRGFFPREIRQFRGCLCLWDPVLVPVLGAREVTRGL